VEVGSESADARGQRDGRNLGGCVRWRRFSVLKGADCLEQFGAKFFEQFGAPNV